MLGVTCTQNTNTNAMRALLAENVPEPPRNVRVGPGTGWRSLRTKSAQHGVRSVEGMPGMCKGQGGAHLLVDDADQVLGAVSFQGVS